MSINGFNKKGQQIFAYMMIAIIIFIFIIILANPLKDQINQASINSSSVLNCSNSSLAAENKAICIIMDMTVFYYIGMLVAISIAIVTGKKGMVGIITAIMVFIVVSILINPLKTLIILARDSSHLNCASSSITVGGKLACIAVDIWLFYFSVFAISAAITYIFIIKVLPKIKEK